MRSPTLAAVIAALVMTTSVAAQIQTKHVEYTVAGQTYDGVLAWDDAAKDKRPGVAICHEWWGMNDYAQSRAKQLAEQGYTAFAFDLFGKGKTTADPKQAGEWAGKLYAEPKAMREVAAAGLKVLADDPHTDASRLAAIGYCMGGTVALELARSGLANTANLKAIVCFHTSTIAAKDPADNANIKGSVLVCNGAADTFVKPEEIAGFQKQMADAKIDYQFISYAGATHSFTNPGADAFGIPGIKHDPKADARSWRAMLDLFREVLGTTSKKKEAAVEGDRQIALEDLPENMRESAKQAAARYRTMSDDQLRNLDAATQMMTAERKSSPSVAYMTQELKAEMQRRRQNAGAAEPHDALKLEDLPEDERPTVWRMVLNYGRMSVDELHVTEADLQKQSDDNKNKLSVRYLVQELTAEKKRRE